MKMCIVIAGYQIMAAALVSNSAKKSAIKSNDIVMGAMRLPYSGSRRSWKKRFGSKAYFSHTGAIKKIPMTDKSGRVSSPVGG